MAGAAASLGVSLNPSGHSRRYEIRRYRYFAKNGVDVWRMQALSRHSSSAILQYVRGAIEGSTVNIVGEAINHKEWETVRSDVTAA